MRKIKTLFLLSVIVALVVLWFILEVNGAFTGNGVKKLNIENGDYFSNVISGLSDNDFIHSEFLFKVYAKVFYNNELSKIIAGEVVMEGKRSYKEIMAELISDNRIKDEFAVTIPEGYELREIADLLERKGLIDRNKFYDIVKNYDFSYPYIKNLEKNENRLEGFLFPDTYIFSKDIDDEFSIINRMLKRFDEVYSKYKNQEDKAGFSTYEVITLASVIEREAATKEDFYKVSSVFHNRLSGKGGIKLLQSCATVQYVLKERKKVLTNYDIKIDSPYNTYIYEGLPKGPIASPGELAIKAALNPENTDYLYFLNDREGKLHYSKTDSEHQSKVSKYVN